MYKQHNNPDQGLNMECLILVPSAFLCLWISVSFFFGLVQVLGMKKVNFVLLF